MICLTKEGELVFEGFNQSVQLERKVFLRQFHDGLAIPWSGITRQYEDVGLPRTVASRDGDGVEARDE